MCGGGAISGSSIGLGPGGAISNSHFPSSFQTTAIKQLLPISGGGATVSSAKNTLNESGSST